MYSTIYFSQIYTFPLVISSVHHKRNYVLSGISYCTSNESSLIFIELDLLPWFFMHLLFSLCWMIFFCHQAACGRHEEDIHEQAKSFFMLSLLQQRKISNFFSWLITLLHSSWYRHCLKFCAADLLKLP